MDNMNRETEMKRISIFLLAILSLGYYYVLNRDPNWFGEKNMDPLPVTDIIDLGDKM